MLFWNKIYKLLPLYNTIGFMVMVSTFIVSEFEQGSTFFYNGSRQQFTAFVAASPVKSKKYA